MKPIDVSPPWYTVLVKWTNDFRRRPRILCMEGNWNAKGFAKDFSFVRGTHSLYARAVLGLRVGRDLDGVLGRELDAV